MKVIHLTSTYFPLKGGIEDFIYNIVKYTFHNYNVKSEVWVLNSFFKRTDSFDENNYNTVRFFKSKLKWITEILNLKKSKKVIHLHDPTFSLITIFSIFHFRKVLISTHGFFFHTSESFFKILFFKHIVVRFYKKASIVICVSKSDFERLKFYGLENIVLLENPIDTKKFTYTKRKDIEFKFIYFGRFSKNKNIQKLICFFKHVYSKNNRSKFILAGDIETAGKKLKKEISESSFIEFYNKPSDKELRCLINDSNFFVSATKYEGFGISILEAACSGLVVICSDIAPLNKIFNNDENAFLVDFEKSDSFDDILSLITNDYKVEVLRKNLNKLKKMYSWDSRICQFYELYTKTIL